EVECWWQLSASCGFVEGVLNSHLLFQLHEPMRDEDIKASLRPFQIDCALFDPIQIHYIADPIVEGAPDPLPKRTGWRKGMEEAVKLPAPPAGATGKRAGGLGRGAGGDGATLAQMG